MSVEHAVAVGAAMKLDARGLWQSRCLCGWLGPIGNWSLVLAAGASHVRDKEAQR